jgi:hypothetical protein
MADAQNGYMTTDRFSDDVSGGWVLRTSDGGVTWRPQLIGSSPIASDGLESPAAGSAFALGLSPGRSSDLFFTENGGDQGQATAVTATPSATKLKKAGNVRFTVKVSPAVIGAPVALRVRTAKSNAWRSVAVPGGAFTKSAGTYTVTVKVKSTSYFVAQWRGDADRNGDGSPAVKVQVGKR